MLTAATFAVNVAVVAPAATVTLPGTDTALLLLARVMPIPPDKAAELTETVHLVVPVPVNEVLPHESPLTEGVATVVADALFSLIEVDFEIDPCFAVSVTVCDDLTADTLARKLAVLAPEETVTEEGTVTAVLLLARLTIMPVLAAAELNVTVHLSEPDPVIDALAQLRLESDAVLAPLPCSLTALDKFVMSLLIAFTFSCPVKSVVSFGVK
jgi:hypothetical protein